MYSMISVQYVWYTCIAYRAPASQSISYQGIYMRKEGEPGMHANTHMLHYPIEPYIPVVDTRFYIAIIL